MVIHDQHIHSHFSEDSKESLTNYLDIARSKDIKYFVTCEHVDYNPPTSKYDWIADFKGLKEECKSLQDKYPDITFLYGIELGYRNDHLDDMKNILKDNEFDLIQLSVHDDIIHDYYLKESFLDTKNDLDKYFDMIYEAITNWKEYNVLSHFDYGFKSARYASPNVDISKYEDKLTKIFKVLINDGKALEINSKVQSVINDDNHLRYILKLYKSLGGEKITLSSDAHTASKYYLNFDKYMQMIKEAGFNKLSYYIKQKEYYYDI